MAKVSSFGFTNTTAGTHTVSPIALGLTTNYALAGEDANNAILNNKTAPIDAEELITFRSRGIAQVNTDLNIQYPSPVKSGIQYQVQVEDVLTTTDTDDSSFRVDEPIVALLTIRHPKSGNIGGTQIAAVMNRLLGCIMKADGTWRFDDLMRGAERPIVD
jgi:hypothetical protein